MPEERSTWESIGRFVRPVSSVPVLDFAFEAAFGVLSQRKLDQLNDEARVDTKRALGPNADRRLVEIMTAEAIAEKENYLRSIGAHPEQAGQGQGEAEKFSRKFVAVIVVSLVLFFAYEAMKTYRAFKEVR